MVREEPITSFRGTFLSNFWPCEVVYQGDTYPSVEHAYQAAKSLSKNFRQRIARLKCPAEAKRVGRNLFKEGPKHDNYPRKDWNSIRLDVMRKLLVLKFKPNSELAGLLLDTGNAELVEGNTWGDRFWGRCRGEGSNHLGRILMEIRDDLRNETQNILINNSFAT